MNKICLRYVSLINGLTRLYKSLLTWQILPGPATCGSTNTQQTCKQAVILDAPPIPAGIELDSAGMRYIEYNILYIYI